MLRIIQDKREQCPFLFIGFPVEVTSGTLSTGDYSLAGFEDRIALERKSLGDLIGCLAAGRERFIREMERLRSFEAAAVVVEAPFSDLAGGHYRSHFNPDSARQSVISIMANYRMPFFFAAGRSEAEQYAFDFLRHYARHAADRYRAIQIMAAD